MHTRPLATELLSDQSGRAILILDGTYIYCQKSANNILQRRTYSMHKGRPLIKPMLVVSTTGYIVSCLGPYFADYKNNDAAITKHILYNNTENITQWLEKGDIIVIDRGFRDALDYLHEHEYRTFMPAFLDKKSKQFSTTTANETRFVTKIRWVIESANGRIKQWRIFDKVLPNSLLKTVGDLVGIVCALQNAYGAPFVNSTVKDKIIAEKMILLKDKTNELAHFVAQLKNKSEKSIKWSELDAANAVKDFPKLTFEQLNDLTLGRCHNYMRFFVYFTFCYVGIYQLKQAKAYTVEHLSADGKYTAKIALHRHDLLRAKIQSRHKNNVAYDVWVQYSSNIVLGWYCTCPAGARVVGCCAHVASIVWYLSFARFHPEQLKQECSSFLNSFADAAGSRGKVRNAEFRKFSEDPGIRGCFWNALDVFGILRMFSECYEIFNL